MGNIREDVIDCRVTEYTKFADYDDEFFAYATECCACVDASSDVMGINILRMTIMEFSRLIMRVMLKFAACYSTAFRPAPSSGLSLTCPAIISLGRGGDCESYTEA